MGTTSAITVPTTVDTTSGIQFPTSSTLDNSDSSAVPSTTPDAFTTTSTTSSASPSSSTSSAPPTSTVEPQTHTSSFRNFITNPHIFVPLLASVLGAVLLAFLLWFLCKRCSCHSRRHGDRERNRSSYYYPSGGQEWQVVQAEKTRGGSGGTKPWWNKLFGSREEPEDVILGPRYVGVEDDFVDTTAEAEKDVERLGGDKEWDITLATEGDNNDNDNDDGDDDGDDQDPFLPSKPKRARTGASAKSRPRPRSFRSPSRAPSRSSASASAASRPLLPALSLLRDSFDFGADEEEGGSDREDDRVPWESLRHKSIKRAILEKVDEEKRWTDSMRGLRSAEAGTWSLAREDHGRGRSRSTRTDRSLGDGEKGFRIVVESPPPPLRIPTPGSSGAGEKSGKQAPWSFPFPLFWGRQEVDVSQGGGGGGGGGAGKDPYTPVPTRMKSGSRSRGSSFAGSPIRVSPVKSGAGRHARPLYASPSPSVLRMQSPPSLMTPQMESALCFTPVVGSSARMGRGAEDVDRDSPSHAREGVRSPRRGRLVKSVIRGRTEERNEKEMEPEPGSIYTKTYRDRTDRAMKRVEAIVESGWNERGRARD